MCILRTYICGGHPRHPDYGFRGCEAQTWNKPAYCQINGSYGCGRWWYYSRASPFLCAGCLQQLRSYDAPKAQEEMATRARKMEKMGRQRWLDARMMMSQKKKSRTLYRGGDNWREPEPETEEEFKDKEEKKAEGGDGGKGPWWRVGKGKGVVREIVHVKGKASETEVKEQVAHAKNARKRTRDEGESEDEDRELVTGTKRLRIGEELVPTTEDQDPGVEVNDNTGVEMNQNTGVEVTVDEQIDGGDESQRDNGTDDVTSKTSKLRLD